MARLIGLAEHTLFADLLERSMDALFDEQFPENGSFVERAIKDRAGVSRTYWYYQGYRPASQTGGQGKRYALYVGPADDPAIADRVRRFRSIKVARSERGRLVDALVGAGMPRPPIVLGRIVEALSKAGVFRLRAVLVGTAAYQTYGGVIGARPAQSAAITGDVDVAQFRSVSIGVDDSVPDMRSVLQGVDPTFEPVPGLSRPSTFAVFANATGFRVDFLTAHRGGDDEMGTPLSMPALGGASARPLRFMDFLIRFPTRSVVLHGPGIPVNVPAPERFAVHKLIISNRRNDDALGHREGAKGSRPSRRDHPGARSRGPATRRRGSLRRSVGAGFRVATPSAERCSAAATELSRRLERPRSAVRRAAGNAPRSGSVSPHVS